MSSGAVEKARRKKKTKNSCRGEAYSGKSTYGSDKI